MCSVPLVKQCNSVTGSSAERSAIPLGGLRLLSEDSTGWRVDVKLVSVAVQIDSEDRRNLYAWVWVSLA